MFLHLSRSKFVGRQSTSKKTFGSDRTRGRREDRLRGTDKPSVIYRRRAFLNYRHGESFGISKDFIPQLIELFSYQFRLRKSFHFLFFHAESAIIIAFYLRNFIFSLSIPVFFYGVILLFRRMLSIDKRYLMYVRLKNTNFCEKTTN